ncbi:hypothetical protein [Glutamicibacter sp. PS]|uniref:hypothetical protein n=1 Tax=Glutamicibacter sp. PS TaxID=3075634 RepID=UPI00284A7EED|nr:hypothetical protein [Glutamicibacter sp. PS]MDR4534419.1 hypothetical protein [Glutamicibacter sp. PS]
MLAKILAKCFTNRAGLNAAYLPYGVKREFADAIVSAANEIEVRPDYAFLITPTGDSGAKTSGEAVQYRQGRHLAIIADRHPDLGSVTGVFSAVMNSSFPEASSSSVSVREISDEFVTDLFSRLGWVEYSDSTRQSCSDLVAQLLELLAGLYTIVGQGTAPWNVQWMAAVDQGLTNFSNIIALDSPTMVEAESYFKKYLYASFGMPTPNDSRHSHAKQLADAFNNYWSDSASIQNSIEMLRCSDDISAEPYPLAIIPWKDVDRKMAISENIALVFNSLVSMSLEYVKHLSTLTEKQFLDPSGGIPDLHKLTAFTDGGFSLGLGEGLSSDEPYAVFWTYDTWEDEYRSERIRIRLPLSSAPTNSGPDAHNVKLVASPKAVHWEQDYIEFDANTGGLQVYGRLRMPAKTERREGPLRVTLRSSIAPGDPLFGLADPNASCTITAIDSKRESVLVLPIAGKNKLKLGKPVYVASDTYGSAASESPDEEQLLVQELDSSVDKYRFVAWGAQSGDVLADGEPCSDFPHRPDLFIFDSVPLPSYTVVIGSLSVDFKAIGSSKAPLSPVVAAARKMLPSREPMPPSESDTARGFYETWLTQNCMDEVAMDALGHIVMSDDAENMFDPVVKNNSGFLMCSSMSSQWHDISDADVPEELLKSSAAESFRLAFRKLDLLRRLKADTDKNSHLRPSTVSWRHLWEGDRRTLTEYLESYAELVRESNRLGDPVGQFWAAYPFSISVWSTKGGAKSSAVLLSPLHPVRLAWLAGVEYTLWHSEYSESLSGTIEGWNFPYFGPREDEFSRFIAVPMETGAEQIFVGWSMLVVASMADPGSLTAPATAGGRGLPGTAASGLNSTAVSAAIRNYKKLNPHLTTLTVDLAAPESQVRLAEVDEAVIEESLDWVTDKNVPLRGGLRVWDSTKRAGNIPIAAINKFVKNAKGVPVAWNRYEPKPNQYIRSDVRILQDGGIRVRLRDRTAYPQRGILGNVPLRRFEASSQKITRNFSSNIPEVSSDHGWQPFADALVELEGAGRGTVIETKLFASALADGSTNWTVAGESLMNPSAMSEIIKKSSDGEQHLWEYRPQFLESPKSTPAIERRPFVSIARVPLSFRRQVRELLRHVHQTELPDENLELSVLTRLGARGIGLSSMLTMGGTHAAGALGFYLAFEFMEKCKETMQDLFVLPIDACDGFLRSLAAESRNTDSTKRADLLIIRLEKGHVTLSPLEIKFYGMSSSAHDSLLPNGTELGILNEAATQAKTTADLLNKVSLAWRKARQEESNRALWSSSFAALIESGVRLSPSADDNLEGIRHDLQAVVNGDFEIHVGSPLISYFKLNAQTPQGYSNVVRVVDDGQIANSLGAFGLMSASAELAFNSLSSTNNDLVHSWIKLVEWSLSSHRDAPVASGSKEKHVPTKSNDGGEEVSPTVDSIDIGAKAESPIGTESSKAESTDEIGGQISRVHRHVLDEPTVGPDATIPSTTGSHHRGSGWEPNDSPVSAQSECQVDHGIKFKIGDGLNGTNAEFEFWPSNTRLNQLNIGIVGDLGTGKTQLLKTLIYQLRKSSMSRQDSPLSLLIFDYKRDFQDEEFLKSVGGKLLRIDNIPLNFFALRGEYKPMRANQRANEFIDVLDKIYGGIGPVQKDRLQVAITDLYRELNPLAPTIADVLDRYKDGSDKPDSVTSILRKFVISEVFSTNRENLQSFDQLMDNGVVVVALNDFGTDDDGKNALVVLFLNLYYDYMLNSRKWPYRGSDPQLRQLNSFLLVDEAVNIMKYKFPVLMNLLLQGREFGVGVILASQYLSHFRQGQEDYAQPLLTWFVHKVPGVSQKDMTLLGLPERAEQIAKKIQTLEVHHALYKSLDVSGKFLRTLPYYELMHEADGGVDS